MQKVSEIVSQNVGDAITNFNTWGGLVVNVKSYGAEGDGATNDSQAFNNALAAAALAKATLVIPAGTYIINNALIANVGVKGITGLGTVVLDFSGLPATTVGLTIQNTFDFILENIGVTNAITQVSACVWLYQNTRITVRDCRFVTTGGEGMGLSKTTTAWIHGNYFNDTGRLSLTTMGSNPALWVGEAPTYANTDIHVFKNKFLNTNWSGMYFFPSGGVIDDNDFLGCRESTIFVNYSASRIKITNNRIVCGSVVNIANFGIEIGFDTKFLQIIGNNISNAGEAGITISGIDYFVIANNICWNNGVGIGATEQRAGICIRESVANASKRGTIKGNLCFDSSGVAGKQLYGLSTYRTGTGGAIDNIIVEGNLFYDNVTSNVFIYDATTLIYDTTRFRNNVGYAEKPKTLTFSITAVTGYKNFTGFGFRPSFVEIFAWIDSTDQWCRVTYDTRGVGIGNGVYHYGTTTKQIAYINLTDAAGSPQTGADWDTTSLLNDGFRMNFNAAALACKVVVTCYP